MAQVVETPGSRFSNAGSAAAVNAATGAVNAPSDSGSTPDSPGANPPNQGLYGEYQAHALDAYNKAQIAIQQRRAGIYQNNGFKQDGTVDGLNSTGAYQQMKHSQALELQGAENQAQERHLGAHGLGAQVAEAPRFQEDADSAAWEQNFLSQLDGNSAELSGAEGTYQQALLDARRAQIEDDIANGRYATPDPAAPTDPAAAATPGTRATAAAKKLAATKAPAKALAARSAALNVKYGLNSKPTVYNGRH